MIDAALMQAIRQKKLDQLAAKHVHGRRQTRLNRWSLGVDFVALAVPVFYFVPRLLAKGTQYEGAVEIVWELLAAILLVLVIVKMVWRWNEKGQKHSTLLGENISLVTHADRLLNDQNASKERVDFFLELADRSEREDRELVGELKDKERQDSYREALKELEPGNTQVLCPVCGASPWHFTKGTCQACGNTPRR